MNILTPFGDGAKFVIAESPVGHGHTLFFVDGHGYSRAIASSTVTDPNATELEWLATSAGACHKIPCGRAPYESMQPSRVDAEQLELGD